MNFNVVRTIGATRFRFGVAMDRNGHSDTTNEWSTGPSGEYHRRTEKGLFYTEDGTDATASLQETGAARRWGGLRLSPLIIGALAAGSIFVLFGLLNIARKNTGGGILLLILGLIAIVAPWVATQKQRREARLERERLQQERASEEERMRQAVGELSRDIEAIGPDSTDDQIDRLRRARAARNIPYEAIAPFGIAAVLRTGFGMIAEGRTLEETANRMRLIGDAVALTVDDQRDALTQLYQIVVWHLLADDRMNAAQEAQLDKIRIAFDLDDDAIAIETSSMRQFEALESVRPKEVPVAKCELELKFQEACHHATRASSVQVRGGREERSTEGELFITSRRVFLGGEKDVEIPLGRIYELNVDADHGRLTILEGGKKSRPWHFILADPIYTAGVIRAAAATPRKPAGLV